MKKGMREWVSGDDVCDCCFGEQLNNNKPFRPLYIFKYVPVHTGVKDYHRSNE